MIIVTIILTLNILKVYLTHFLFLHILVSPQPCQNGCHCYFIQDEGNYLNCSSTNLTHLLANSVTSNITDYLDFSKNSISTLCGNRTYLKHATGLILWKNQVRNIYDDFINALQQSSIEILDLSNNSLTTLPMKMTCLNSSFTDIRLSNNPFICNCDTLWMKHWMANYTSDYSKMKCDNGRPIHELDAVQMGCFPKELPLWEKILIGVLAAVTVAVVIVIIAISRRWNEVKWFMYLHFDLLDKNDEPENLEGMEYDALLSYR